MSDFNLDAGGDASADASSAMSEVESGAQEITPDEPTILDSGVDTQADSTLTTEPDTDEPAAEPSEEDEEAALLAYAEDPTTPQFARAKIKDTLSYANRLKTDASTFRSEAETLRARYEGKDVLAADEISRMRAAEEQVYNLQSITATPEEIDRTLREMNPRVYDDYVNHSVWNALTEPDGSPNLSNLQAVVDKFTGDPGKVMAKDVLAAMDALKNERITPYDLHDYATAEQFEAAQRQAAEDKRIAERDALSVENARYQETQIRTGELDQAVTGLKNQAVTAKTSLLEQFKLTPQPNEPKAAKDYKDRVNARLDQLIDQAPQQIRELGDIAKIIQLLGQPGSKPLPGRAAAEEVRRVLNSPQYQQTTAKAMSALRAQMEQVVSQEAYFYKLAMKGLEFENSKAKTARPVIGAPNQSAGLPKLTPEQLAKASAAERNRYVSEQTTAELNELMYGGGNRLGQ